MSQKMLTNTYYYLLLLIIFYEVRTTQLGQLGGALYHMSNCQLLIQIYIC